MDKIIFNVPFKRVYFLRDFLREEEKYEASLGGQYPFVYEMFVSTFLKRRKEYIQLVDELLGVVCKSDEPCLAHRIKTFLDDYFNYLKDSLLESGEFPTKLLFKKEKSQKHGIDGWYPHWVWKKNLSHKSYSQKLVYLNY